MQLLTVFNAEFIEYKNHEFLKDSFAICKKSICTFMLPLANCVGDFRFSYIFVFFAIKSTILYDNFHLYDTNKKLIQF